MQCALVKLSNFLACIFIKIAFYSLWNLIFLFSYGGVTFFEISWTRLINKIEIICDKSKDKITDIINCPYGK